MENFQNGTILLFIRYLCFLCFVSKNKLVHLNLLKYLYVESIVLIIINAGKYTIKFKY